MFGLVGFMAFNATFSNISVILWQSTLLVEETGIPEKITDLSHLSHNVVSSTPRLSGVRTQVNPTTNQFYSLLLKPTGDRTHDLPHL
jgi:hypothetical protein